MDQQQKAKTSTDVTFENKNFPTQNTVSTQTVTDQAVSSFQMVEDYLWDMFGDEDEFVVLTLADILHQIRFVQAAQIKNGLIVQLGIEEGDRIRLVEKECTREECMDIFREYYNSSYVRDVEKYQPVAFYV
ncbi:MAG: hypothetical protein HFH33_09505 [Eubacterium sp.]|jgi:hypothetical protein|nr:hypothetical protein [Eubacterium sp.]